MLEDDNQLRITFQRCNGFVTCSAWIAEVLYINFLCAGMSTLGLYPEEIVPGDFYFQ